MNENTQDTKFERLWSIGVGIFAGLQLVVGPLLLYFSSIENVIALISIALIAMSAWRLRNGLPSAFATSALILLIIGLIILGAQLVPLPVSVWTLMPGRQIVVDTLTAAQIDIGPMPLSLDPHGSLSVVIYILPSLALFFASLSIAPQFRLELATTIVGIATMCALLGLIQRFQGGTSPFFLFPNSYSQVDAKGTFQNQNFFAAQLYCAVPFLAALTVSTFSSHRAKRFVLSLLFLVLFITLMAALGATGSRAGLGFAMLAVLLSGLIVWSGRDRSASTSNALRYTLLLSIGSVLLLAQFGLIALLQLAQTDVSSDFRSIIASTTIEAVKAYFPFGSGFGTFVPVYKLFENTDKLMPQFVNTAHNDWLQLALEGGLPMMVLLFGFILWYLAASINIWRKGSQSLEDLFLRSASLIVLLLLLHSLVDYPLRTRALMGLFAVCCGFLAFGVQFKPWRGRTRQKGGNKSSTPMPRVVRNPPYFAKKRGE